MHRSPDPPLARVRLIEGSKGCRVGAQGIYRAKDAEAEMKALETFETSDWGQRYPAIALSWRRNWDYNNTGRIHRSET